MVIVLIAALILFWNELRSLRSLKKIDDYGMYQMTYYGDYGFDEFLKTGAESDADIEAFVTNRLLKGFPIDLGVTGDGCTAFVVKNETGDILFGRNFDFEYAPSLQLRTTPANGYSSICQPCFRWIFGGESAGRRTLFPLSDTCRTLSAFRRNERKGACHRAACSAGSAGT